ncbi:hypothetical protein QJS10_CPA05g00322 [Acorus calamus]|uniref:PUM-HD domain-containing protein n=1 Tax=Acorus calamus TaxID=4465 RepID=A0AAV9ETW8_ACOCL|nr:hypothetical protein QJS10_CPA05g00322 [Acorus calamus]
MAATGKLDRTEKRKRVRSAQGGAGSEKPTLKRSKPSPSEKPLKSHAKDSKKPLKPFKKASPSKPSPSEKPLKSHAKDSKKPLKPFKKASPSKGPPAQETQEPQSKKERRVVSKVEAEERRKKRKKHYSLQQELARLWEKMRRRNIEKGERSKLVTEGLQKMKGKIKEIATSHVSSRVLQTCVKYCSQEERNVVFEELRPDLLTLARSTYAVHLVKKLLDNATKKQLEGFISSLHGQVAALLRHMVGSVVVEHAFQLGNGSQKQRLLSELYSTELQLFKDLTSNNEGRLIDIISKLGLQKSSVLQHMSSVIQPILEKGIVDHSILHSALMEYFSIADKISAADVIQQLSGSLLVRMIHTRDGSRVGILCIRHGSAKERKKIIKGMKGHVRKIACDQYGCLVLVSILSVVDDTKLIKKVIIHELEPILKDLVFDKNGRRPLLQLLHPLCPRYFSPDDLASLNLSVPSPCTQGEISAEEEQTRASAIDESDHGDAKADADLSLTDVDNGVNSGKNLKFIDGGKKDPSIRRSELFVESGLAERLIDTCIESVGELLKSNFGKEVIYEVATGGSDAVLQCSSAEKIDELHRTIASLAALPKTEELQDHILEHFHSSRTIRKLVLECPKFASTLWKSALTGKCEMWAQGHSCKIVSAFLESSHDEVRHLAEKELQPLVKRGILQNPQ